MSFIYRGTSSSTIPGLRAVLQELPIGAGVKQAHVSAAGGKYASKLEPLELTFSLRLEAPSLTTLLERMDRLSALAGYGDSSPYSLYVNPIQDMPNGPWYYQAVAQEVLWARHKELWSGQFGLCVVEGEMTFVCPSPMRRTAPQDQPVTGNQVVLRNPSTASRASAIVRVATPNVPSGGTLTIGSAFTISGPLNTTALTVDSFAGTVTDGSGRSLVHQVRKFSRMRTSSTSVNYGAVAVAGANASFGEVTVRRVLEAW